MEYKFENNTVTLYNADSFDIGQILECGQCFRFAKIEDYKYRIIAMQKILYIEQIGKDIKFYPCTKEDFENIWIKYFDLNRNYSELKNLLSNDDVLKNAINYASGIRILNQETWECLISFIISQNNRIPMIRQVVENISRKYGSCIDLDFYSFPTLEQLSTANEEELRECKTGFRAKYILNVIQMVKSGEVPLNKFNTMTTKDIRDNLMKVKGVGPKIADCVLLFSQSRTEVFPTDVWIKRVMQHFYFKEETGIKEIHQYAYDKFGNLAGIAQQYLFNYARQEKIK